jgi:hypothetical protein
MSISAVPKIGNSSLIIYIPFLKEGTECWRPVEAERIGTNT